ncbi:tryptophan 2,3-dioxygenase-like [Oscarella lobularis]|uniref:tryptophan 2,3-dioxygenase-like n=1 Tax=Oscarella lobularis TaxID=121494 RepID=UPI003313ABC3
MSCPVGRERDDEEGKGLHYLEYLKIPELLNLQQPLSKSAENPNGVHDEHLFILMHQVYELWFKQILHELDSIMNIMTADFLDESLMLVINSRTSRIVVILKIVVEQIKVLETMTPLDFLDFRHYLSQSSGFQSLQFRILECKLGIRDDLRISYGGSTYKSAFSDDRHRSAAEQLEQATKNPSFLTLVDRWLARTPGLDGEFQFFDKYSKAVREMLAEMKDEAKKETSLSIRNRKLKDHETQTKFFKQLMDVEEHASLVEKGQRRLSHKATQGALMVALYRDEPRFQPAYHFISSLMDIDSLLMQWRNNHSLFVQRILGDKMGTGGSSGYRYLRSTVSDRYKVFLDFFNLSSYIIPRWHIPKLTSEMKDTLGAYFTADGEKRRAGGGESHHSGAEKD